MFVPPPQVDELMREELQHLRLAVGLEEAKASKPPKAKTAKVRRPHPQFCAGREGVPGSIPPASPPPSSEEQVVRPG